MSASSRVAGIRLRSRVNSFAARLECVVVDRITDSRNYYCASNVKLPSGLVLADPRFNVSANIDMLIGADLFRGLLCVGQIRATSDHPILQKILLSWIIAGRAVGVVRSLSRMNALHFLLP